MLLENSIRKRVQKPSDLCWECAVILPVLAGTVVVNEEIFSKVDMSLGFFTDFQGLYYRRN
jgi:hypothetical protein